jgi:rhodanese-related sulfurtransferase
MESMGILDFLGLGARGSACVTDDEAEALAGRGALVIDVRSRAEWDQGHCDGSVCLPMDELPARLGELPADRPILVVCATGARARHVAEVLRAQGYDAHVLGPWQRNPRCFPVAGG